MSFTAPAARKQVAYDIEGQPLRVGSSVYMLSNRRHYDVVDLVSSDELDRDLEPTIWYPVLSSADPSDPQLLDHIPVRPQRLMRQHY